MKRKVIHHRCQLEELASSDSPSHSLLGLGTLPVWSWWIHYHRKSVHTRGCWQVWMTRGCRQVWLNSLIFHKCKSNSVLFFRSRFLWMGSLCLYTVLSLKKRNMLAKREMWQFLDFGNILFHKVAKGQNLRATSLVVTLNVIIPDG